MTGVNLSIEKLLENQPGILVAFDLNFKIFYVNRCVAGLTKEMVIGVSAFEFVKPEDRESVRKVYEEVIATQKTIYYEVTGYGPNGTDSYYSTHAGPIFDQDKLIGIAVSSIDITKQRNRENELKQKFEHLVEATQGIFWESEPVSFRTTFVSNQILQILGFQPCEWLSLKNPWSDRIHPKDKDRVLEIIQQQLAQKKPHRLEYRLLKKNGKYIWVEDLVTPVFERGELVAIRGLMVDMTARKNAELLQQVHSEVLDLLVQSKGLDEILERVIQFVEEVIPGVMGSVHLYREYDQMLYHCAAKSLSNRYRTAVREVKVAPNLGTCGSAVFSGKREVTEDILTDPRWKDFSDLAVGEGLRACWSEPIRGSKGKVLGTFAIYRPNPGVPDSEELAFVEAVRSLSALAIEKKLEAEEMEAARLRSLGSAKLSALGEMAAGIAHEVNNPLTVIVGKIDRILSNLKTGTLQLDRLKEDLLIMEETSHRIAKLVRAMRLLGRNNEKEEKIPFLLKTIIDEVLQVMTELFRSKEIQVQISLESISQTTVLCRPSEIAQIFWNLLKNSFDSVVDTSERWIQVGAEVDGQFVKIHVRDGGSKIRPEIREKMMHPFFTTKKVGEGVGLGLSISKSIAENHGGDLYYEDNKPNNSFVFEIPR